MNAANFDFSGCCKLRFVGIDCGPNVLLPRLSLPRQSENNNTLLAMKLLKKQRFLSHALCNHKKTRFSINNPIIETPAYPRTERGPWAAPVGKQGACRPLISGDIDRGLTSSDLAIPSLHMRVSRRGLSFNSKQLMRIEQSLSNAIPQSMLLAARKTSVSKYT